MDTILVSAMESYWLEPYANRLVPILCFAPPYLHTSLPHLASARRRGWRLTVCSFYLPHSNPEAAHFGKARPATRSVLLAMD